MRSREWRLGVLALAPLLVAGCSSSKHFPGEARGAREAIDRAEDAGAKKSARELYDSARESVDDAREAEDAATKDAKTARDQLESAEKRLSKAERMLERRKAERARYVDERQAQSEALARLEARADQLRETGASSDEVSAAYDPQVGIARRRLARIDAVIAALDEQIRLRELERTDAVLDRKAAQARIDTADQRLQVARALFQRAQEEASAAEAESLNATRLDTRAGLVDAGR